MKKTNSNDKNCAIFTIKTGDKKIKMIFQKNIDKDDQI